MKEAINATKQKLIGLVSALEEENIIDYCYTFIGLKVYGHAKLPDSITAELRQIWEKFMLHEEQAKPEPEQTEEEKQAGEYRASIVRLLYGIDNVAILNYIHIIVSDIAKESESLDTVKSISSFTTGLLSARKGGETV